MIRSEAERLVVDSIKEHLAIESVDLSVNIHSLGGDSLDFVQICIIIEEKSGKVFTPPDMKTIRSLTVSDLVRLVELL